MKIIYALFELGHFSQLGPGLSTFSGSHDIQFIQRPAWRLSFEFFSGLITPKSSRIPSGRFLEGQNQILLELYSNFIKNLGILKLQNYHY